MNTQRGKNKHRFLSLLLVLSMLTSYLPQNVLAMETNPPQTTEIAAESKEPEESTEPGSSEAVTEPESSEHAAEPGSEAAAEPESSSEAVTEPESSEAGTDHNEETAAAENTEAPLGTEEGGEDKQGLLAVIDQFLGAMLAGETPAQPAEWEADGTNIVIDYTYAGFDPVQDMPGTITYTIKNGETALAGADYKLYKRNSDGKTYTLVETDKADKLTVNEDGTITFTPNSGDYRLVISGEAVQAETEYIVAMQQDSVHGHGLYRSQSVKAEDSRAITMAYRKAVEDTNEDGIPVTITKNWNDGRAAHSDAQKNHYFANHVQLVYKIEGSEGWTDLNEDAKVALGMTSVPSYTSTEGIADYSGGSVWTYAFKDLPEKAEVFNADSNTWESKGITYGFREITEDCKDDNCEMSNYLQVEGQLSDNPTEVTNTLKNKFEASVQWKDEENADKRPSYRDEVVWGGYDDEAKFKAFQAFIRELTLKDSTGKSYDAYKRDDSGNLILEDGEKQYDEEKIAFLMDHISVVSVPYETTWKIQVHDLPGYDKNGDEISYNIEFGNYAWSSEDGKIWGYTSEYKNSGQFGGYDNALYNNGTASLKLDYKKEFTFQVEWKDGDCTGLRNGEYYLFRYPDDTVNNFDTASGVQGYDKIIAEDGVLYLEKDGTKIPLPYIESADGIRTYTYIGSKTEPAKDSSGNLLYQTADGTKVYLKDGKYYNCETTVEVTGDSGSFTQCWNYDTQLEEYSPTGATYVYFLKQKLTVGDYQSDYSYGTDEADIKFYKPDPNKFEAGKAPAYTKDPEKAEKDEDGKSVLYPIGCILNGGTVVNSLRQEAPLTAEKQWEAKALQGMGSQTLVKVQLQKRYVLRDAKGIETGYYSDWEDVAGQEKIISGFSAMEMTKTAYFEGQPGYTLADTESEVTLTKTDGEETTTQTKILPEGTKIEYRIVETGLVLDKAGALFGVTAPEGTQIASLKTEKDTVKFYDNNNEEIDGVKYQEFKDGQIVLKGAGDEGTDLCIVKEETGMGIVNKLVDRTQVVVHKTWNGKDTWPKDAVVTMILRREDGQPVGKDLEGNDIKSITLSAGKTTDIFKNLPRFDEQGREIVYFVEEYQKEYTSEGITYRYNDTSYSKDNMYIDADGNEVKADAAGAICIRAEKAVVDNITPVGEGITINVNKRWYDDGDSLCRENTLIGIFRRSEINDGSAFNTDGTLNADKALDSIVLTDGMAWTGKLSFRGDRNYEFWNLTPTAENTTTEVTAYPVYVKNDAGQYEHKMDENGDKLYWNTTFYTEANISTSAESVSDGKNYPVFIQKTKLGGTPLFEEGTEDQTPQVLREETNYEGDQLYWKDENHTLTTTEVTEFGKIYVQKVTKEYVPLYWKDGQETTENTGDPVYIQKSTSAATADNYIALEISTGTNSAADQHKVIYTSDPAAETTGLFSRLRSFFAKLANTDTANTKTYKNVTESVIAAGQDPFSKGTESGNKIGDLTTPSHYYNVYAGETTAIGMEGYVIYNQRRGNVHLDISKNWTNGELPAGEQPKAAYFAVSQWDYSKNDYVDITADLKEHIVNALKAEVDTDNTIKEISADKEVAAGKDFLQEVKLTETTTRWLIKISNEKAVEGTDSTKVMHALIEKLPKYDHLGRLISYKVDEVAVEEPYSTDAAPAYREIKDGTVKVAVKGTLDDNIYDSYICGIESQWNAAATGWHNSDDSYTWKASNVRSQKFDVDIRKVWRDDGTANAYGVSVVRPDIYFRVYRIAIKAGEGRPQSEDDLLKLTKQQVKDLVDTGAAEWNNKDYRWNTTINDWYWDYETEGSFERYDAAGDEYLYFALEYYSRVEETKDDGTTVSNGYHAEYYNGEVMPSKVVNAPADTLEAFDPADSWAKNTAGQPVLDANGQKEYDKTGDGTMRGNLLVIHKEGDGLQSNGTIINVKERTYDLAGQKRWNNIPADFDLKELPNVSMKLYRKLYEEVTPADNQTTGWEDTYWTKNGNDYVSAQKTDTGAVNTWIKEGWTLQETEDNIESVSLATSFKFEKLPRYDEYGRLYIYRLEEVGLTDGYSSKQTTAGNSMIWTNTYDAQASSEQRVEISVHKTWIVPASWVTFNTDGAPEVSLPAAEFQLWRKTPNKNGDLITGSDKKVSVINHTFTVNADNVKQVGTDSYAITGTVIFKEVTQGGQIPYYAPNGKPYVYYVKEVVPNGYLGQTGTKKEQGGDTVDTDADGGLNTLRSENDVDLAYTQIGVSAAGNAQVVYSNVDTCDTLTTNDIDDNTSYVNTYNGIPEVTNVKAEKTWSDSSNRYGTRPTDLVFKLYRTTGTPNPAVDECVADSSEGRDYITYVPDNGYYKWENGKYAPAELKVSSGTTLPGAKDGDLIRFTITGKDGYYYWKESAYVKAADKLTEVTTRQFPSSNAGDLIRLTMADGAYYWDAAKSSYLAVPELADVSKTYKGTYIKVGEQCYQWKGEGDNAKYEEAAPAAVFAAAFPETHTEGQDLITFTRTDNGFDGYWIWSWTDSANHAKGGSYNPLADVDPTLINDQADVPKENKGDFIAFEAAEKVYEWKDGKYTETVIAEVNAAQLPATNTEGKDYIRFTAPDNARTYYVWDAVKKEYVPAVYAPAQTGAVLPTTQVGDAGNEAGLIQFTYQAPEGDGNGKAGYYYWDGSQYVYASAQEPSKVIAAVLPESSKPDGAAEEKPLIYFVPDGTADGKYYWNETKNSYVSIAEAPAVTGTLPAENQGNVISLTADRSADGYYYWDGSKYVKTEPAQLSGGFLPTENKGNVISFTQDQSEDGRYAWNGTAYEKAEFVEIPGGSIKAEDWNQGMGEFICTTPSTAYDGYYYALDGQYVRVPEYPGTEVPKEECGEYICVGNQVYVWSSNNKYETVNFTWIGSDTILGDFGPVIRYWCNRTDTDNTYYRWNGSSYMFLGGYFEDKKADTLPTTVVKEMDWGMDWGMDEEIYLIEFTSTVSSGIYYWDGETNSYKRMNTAIPEVENTRIPSDSTKGQVIQYTSTASDGLYQWVEDSGYQAVEESAYKAQVAAIPAAKVEDGLLIRFTAGLYEGYYYWKAEGTDGKYESLNSTALQRIEDGYFPADGSRKQVIQYVVPRDGYYKWDSTNGKYVFISDVSPAAVSGALPIEQLENGVWTNKDTNQWQYQFYNTWQYEETAAQSRNTKEKWAVYAPNGEKYTYYVVESPAVGQSAGYDNYTHSNNGQVVLSGDTAGYSGTITNTLKTVSVTAKKIWQGTDGTDVWTYDGSSSHNDEELKKLYDLGAIPESITFTVERKNAEGIWEACDAETPVKTKITLNSFDKVKQIRDDGITFAALPENIPGTNIPCEYRVVETYDGAASDAGFQPSDAGKGSSTGISADGLTTYAVNRITLKKVTLEKVWDDQNNQDGKRTGSVTVQLKQGDKIVSYTLNADDQWKLDVWVPNVDIVVTETQVSAYKTPVITAGDGTQTITNTHDIGVLTITADKKWDDYKNVMGTRPDKVTFHLEYKAGNADWTTVTVQEVTTKTSLPTTKEGSEEFIYLKKDADSTETHADGYYYWNYISGKYEPCNEVCTTSSAAQTLTGDCTADSWTSDVLKWENLPKMIHGQAVTYRIVEDAVKGYDTTYSTQAVTGDKKVSVTNTIQKTSIKLNKRWRTGLWLDDAAHGSDLLNAYTKYMRPDSVTYLVEYSTDAGKSWNPVNGTFGGSEIKDGEKTFTVTKGWGQEFYELRGLPKSNSQGVQILYRISETAITYKKTGSETEDTTVTANLVKVGDTVTWNMTTRTDSDFVEASEKEAKTNTIGAYTILKGETKWDETANMWVATIENTLETISLKVTKIWIDENNRDNLRTTVHLGLYLDADNDKEYDAGEMFYGDGICQDATADNGWVYTWEYLPKYQKYAADHTDNSVYSYLVTELNADGKAVGTYAGIDKSYTVTYNQPKGDLGDNKYTDEGTYKTAANSYEAVVTNTREIERFQITPMKEWADTYDTSKTPWVDAESYVRPEKVTVKLQYQYEDAAANTYTWKDVVYAEAVTGDALPTEQVKDGANNVLPIFWNGRYFKWEEETTEAGTAAGGDASTGGGTTTGRYVEDGVGVYTTSKVERELTKDNWTGTPWENLPVNHTNGTPVTYRTVEVSVEDTVGTPQFLFAKPSENIRGIEQKTDEGTVSYKAAVQGTDGNYAVMTDDTKKDTAVTNKLKQITLTKTDGTKPLAGIKFNIVEVKWNEAAKQYELANTGDAGKEAVTDKEGTIIFTGLKGTVENPVTYRITELNTAQGLQLLSQPFYITIPMSVDVAAYNTAHPDNKITNFSGGAERETVGTWDFYQLGYVVTNTANFTMPQSGSAGSWTPGYLGLALIPAAWFMFGRRKRREEEE